MTINPWLEERIHTPNPDTLSVLIEVKPGQAPAVLAQLQALGLAPRSPTFQAFIPVTVPKPLIPQLSALPGVVLVHYDMPASIGAIPVEGFVPSHIDALLGEMRLSSVEVPFFPPAGPLGALPVGQLGLGPLAGLLGRFGAANIKRPGFDLIPTSQTRKLIGAPDDAQHNMTVAVVDTGVLFPAPQWGLNVQLHGTTGEPPLDLQGHGTHVGTTAWGNRATSRFGELMGVSQPSKILGVKVLSNIGFGFTSNIFAGIEWALQQGAKVINMSLGGEAQGGVDDDPYARLFRRIKGQAIFIVAAGNAGPEDWTIGSPAMSPDVLTVGSWSSLYKGVSDFSSRGPSSAWARDHQDIWERDMASYGQDVVKPDVLGPGGGPVGGKTPVDLIYSSVAGWSDSMYDLLVDGAEGMRGTSMASPHVAGLVSLALARGVINNTEDIKSRMARVRQKSADAGYGLLTWSRLQP
ncbi:MAG: S8 family serine peptidase [Dehalococcoidia bacterium]|nr:S8 family serine peptidase [Dehalococcoidia bacterium]